MKQTIKVAAPSARPFLLNEKHFTTLGFNTLIPVYSREVIPGDKISIRPDVLARAAVPNLPNMGDITLNLRAFYVPFAQVFTPFNTFINGVPTPSNNGTLFHQVNTVPIIYQNDLNTLFNTIANGYSLVPGSGSSADFVQRFVPSSGSNVYHRRVFTLKGKKVYQVLTSLGYNFSWVRDASSGYNDVQFSALPLLSFFKAYVDYYVPSRFQQTHPLHLIIKEIANSSTPSLSVTDLKNLFDNYFLYSDHNYFTNSWLTPNAPAPNLNNFGVQVANSPKDHTVSSSSTFINDNGGVGDDPKYVELLANKVTDIGLSMLQKFSSFIRRNNFAGSRAIERLLARFGVHSPEQIMDMSQYLGSMSLNVQNIEVTSNADTSAATDPSNLGDYAGMQYIVTPDSSVKEFSVDVQRHGMVFIFASLGVPSMFVDGVRRHLLHITPTSFYTPEFDGTILQAINSQEYVGRLSYKTDTDYQFIQDVNLGPNLSQGFTERYAEYKTSIDNVTGDFTIPRLSQTIDPFILPRRLFNTNGYVLSTGTDDLDDFCYFNVTGSSNPFTPQKAMTQEDSGQFNRIFRDTIGFADPYYLRFNFSVTAQRRMLNSDETAELLGYGEKKKFDSTGSNYN